MHHLLSVDQVWVDSLVQVTCTIGPRKHLLLGTVLQWTLLSMHCPRHLSPHYFDIHAMVRQQFCSSLLLAPVQHFRMHELQHHLHQVTKGQGPTLEQWSIIQVKGNERWSIGWLLCISNAMYNLLVDFEEGLVSRESIDTTLAAYNESCAEMRSKARDKRISYELTYIEDRV